MALRDKLGERVRPFLEPGEQIQSVFIAQTGSNPYLVFLRWLTVFWTKYVVIVVTNKRIAVVRARWPMLTKPRRLVASYPRASRLGGASGAIWGTFVLGGTKYWVHMHYYDDVRAAHDAFSAR
jgi:hypothetical protein